MATRPGSNKFERLMAAVRERSRQTADFQEMIGEWTVTGHTYSEHATVCTCGHQGIKHQYTIWNSHTRQEMFPIGSECVGHFEDDRLDREVRDLFNRHRRERRRVATERRQQRMAAEAAERAAREAAERAERERLAAIEFERTRPQREAEAREREAAERAARQAAWLSDQRARTDARTREGNRVLTTGKYAGRTFQWVAERERGYIEFVAMNGSHPQLRALVAYARSAR